jgi:cytidylate kinase
MKIAIDGPAAAGKTTIGKALAEHFRLKFVNTGTMYRAAAWALKQGLKLEGLKLSVDKQGRVLIEGRILSDAELYNREIDHLASELARRPEVRAQLITLQREIARQGGVVMEGRDIGTVVMPDADIKLYIDAPLEERARRRQHQRPNTPLAELIAELKERDQRDRGFGRLTPTPDTIILKTAGKTPQESIAQAIGLVEETLLGG